MAFPERGRKRITVTVALLAIMLASPAAVVLAQTSTPSGPLATVGNSFTWSVSRSFSAPGPVTSTSTSVQATVTETVVGVSNGIVTVNESSSSGYSSTVSGSIDSPFRPNSGGVYIYIPPAQLQTTLNGNMSAALTSLNGATRGFTATPSVSQRTIGTSLGDVSPWTLDVYGSGSSTAGGETFQGSETASLSYDSKLGLMVSVHFEASGIVSGSSLSGPASFTYDFKIISSSVPLTPGAGWSFVPVLIGVVAAVVVLVVVLVLFRSHSKNRTMRPPTELGVLTPQQRALSSSTW